jgi:hypothetical protein
MITVVISFLKGWEKNQMGSGFKIFEENGSFRADSLKKSTKIWSKTILQLELHTKNPFLKSQRK